MTHMKSALALAITAAMVAAPAQAEVKMSGTVQMEIMSHEARGSDESVVTMPKGSGSLNGGANALAISASEKLGGGLTAFGAAAWFFSVADGSTAMGSRHRWLGIKSSNAHMKIGRMNGAYKTSLGNDKFAATSLQARNGGGGMSGGNLGHSSYVDDTIEVGFKSGGLKGILQYIADENNSQEGTIGADVSYGNKQWRAGVAMVNYDPDNGDSLTNWKVHGKANFGALYVAAQYESVETGVAAMGLSPANGNVDAADYLWGEVAYKAGNAELIAWAASVSSDDSDNADAFSFAVGGKYHFSKRFNLYGGYRSVDSDNDAVDEDVFLVGGMLKF